MNKDQMIGNWEQLKGNVRKQWGRITDDMALEIDGNRQILSGRIQELYGISQEEAEQQISEWENTYRDTY